MRAGRGNGSLTIFPTVGKLYFGGIGHQIGIIPQASQRFERPALLTFLCMSRVIPQPFRGIWAIRQRAPPSETWQATEMYGTHLAKTAYSKAKYF